MKKIYTFIPATAVFFAMVTLSACHGFMCKEGSGKMLTETQNVGVFDKLNIAGEYNVTVKQDSTNSLTITADDNLMKYIKVEVENGELKIYSKKNLCSSGKFALNIHLRNLSEVTTSGSVTLNSEGKITTKDIGLDFSGRTKTTLNLMASEVSTNGSGSTTLNLSGQAAKHNVQFSGSGHINALGFVVGAYDISSSGSAVSRINVLNSLHISSSGSSTVDYKGDPADVTNDKSGSSSVNKIN